MIKTLDLTAEELLTTTRAVRRRLDLDRPVDPALIEECVRIATQAPTGRNRQRWSFVVVTDPERKAALADVWRRGTAVGSAPMPEEDVRRAYAHPGTMEKIYAGVEYLHRTMHRMPALVVPCITGRTDDAPIVEQAGTWGSILPAVWSFMLAARLHGLGTCWTTSHLHYEEEAAEVLGIDHDRVMQVALTPLAHTVGTSFRPGKRVPVDEVLHWEHW
ncbi:Nitroreductase [Pseudonocardia thermophila]|jgi:Nitroreductase|uniref:Nitroreductase n=1 Tax=Pseudonocardia thermophila TaxID=1848 RepID=A0A1M7A1Y4_PSETH|nr:nitroreductase family protein [Pseudonocardia thermophila]SHL36615.1 Nitroreductase [Pseudonocardia thermophila]